MAKSNLLFHSTSKNFDSSRHWPAAYTLLKTQSFSLALIRKTLPSGICLSRKRQEKYDVTLWLFYFCKLMATSLDRAAVLLYSDLPWYNLLYPRLTTSLGWKLHRQDFVSSIFVQGIGLSCTTSFWETLLLYYLFFPCLKVGNKIRLAGLKLIMVAFAPFT